MNSGSLVKTNDQYEQRFGRVMWGVIVEYSPYFSVVRVNKQHGNAIEVYYKEEVLMCTDDLESVLVH